MVDDDQTIARLLLRILAHAGYRSVRHVATGQEALAEAARSHFILLDQQLPDATGLELLPRLLAAPTQPVVILITAHGSEALAATALRQGAEDYLRKDPSLRDLLPEVLERARRRRALRVAFAAAEADVLRAERLAAIGEMTVSIHHEINNPLMAAMAEVDLLMDEPNLPAAALEGLVATREALHRVRAILRRAGTLRTTERTEYLEGLPMIDLWQGDGAPKPASPRRGNATIQTPDPQVDRVLGLLLRHAGYAVTTVVTPHALPGDACQPNDLIVLPAAVLLDPAGWRPPEDCRAAVIALATSAEQAEAVRDMSRMVILQPFDPATVVQDIAGAMGT